MSEKNLPIHLIGFLFLGNLSLILSTIFFSDKPNILVVFILLAVVSYYILFMFFLLFYLDLLGSLLGGWLGKLLKWLKKVHKKPIFRIVSILLLMGILYPLISLILNDWGKTFEIYTFVILTGLVMFILNQVTNR